MYKLRIYFQIMSSSLKNKRKQAPCPFGINLSKAEYVCLVLFQKSLPTNLTAKIIDSKMSVRKSRMIAINQENFFVFLKYNSYSHFKPISSTILLISKKMCFW